jgi:UDP-N-acetyl-D-mannosaminuronic acid transferase (WecB/TagA/CpsF family)
MKERAGDWEEVLSREEILRTRQGTAGDTRYSCQATELLNYTKPLSVSIMGTSVACATYDSALEHLTALAREPRPAAVCPSNTHILGEAPHNPEFARVLARFDLVLRMGATRAYRLSKEPLRLGPRYLRYHSIFVFYWLWDVLGGLAWKKVRQTSEAAA